LPAKVIDLVRLIRIEDLEERALIQQVALDDFDFVLK
jgi:hypothetical protein